MEATGIKDLDLLVKMFVQGEDKNFKLFKFVRELIQEIENFETQIFEMQSEIERGLAEGGASSKKNQEIKEMERKLVKTMTEIKLMEAGQ